MPNYCCNCIILKGSHKFIESFEKACQLPNDEGSSSEFSFYQTVPIPTEKEKKDAMKQEYISNINLEADLKALGSGMEWLTSGIIADTKHEWVTSEIAYWGTRSDAIDPRVMYGVNQIIIQCDTAWSPPIPWVRHYFKSLPLELQQTAEIVLAYCEFGFGFYGMFSITRNGIRQMHEEISSSDFIQDNEGVKVIPNSKLEKFLREYCLAGLGG